MRIGRTIPPAATSISKGNILKACLHSFKKPKDTLSNFEKELKHFFNAEYCFMVSSGQAALTLILKCLHQLEPQKTDVLIPAFTCHSVPAAIKRAGLNVLLCDLNLNTLDFDRNQLQNIANNNTLSKRLLCAIPTHLYGIPSNIPACKQILGNNTFLVEDAAQSMGNESKGVKLGISSDVGFFSLARGKALSAIQGGIIITNRKDISELLKKEIEAIEGLSSLDKWELILKAFLTTLFQQPVLFWFPKLLPFLRLGQTIYETDFLIRKFSNVQCYFVFNWKKRLLDLQDVRKKNIKLFLKHNNIHLNSKNIKWLEGAQPLIRLPLLLNNKQQRDKLIDKSEALGMGIMPPYPTPVNEIPEIASDFNNAKFKNAKTLSEQLVTIPVHEYMTENDYIKFAYVINRL